MRVMATRGGPPGPYSMRVDQRWTTWISLYEGGSEVDHLDLTLRVMAGGGGDKVVVSR